MFGQKRDFPKIVSPESLDPKKSVFKPYFEYKEEMKAFWELFTGQISPMTVNQAFEAIQQQAQRQERSVMHEIKASALEVAIGMSEEELLLAQALQASRDDMSVSHPLSQEVKREPKKTAHFEGLYRKLTGSIMGFQLADSSYRSTPQSPLRLFAGKPFKLEDEPSPFVHSLTQKKS